MSEIVDYPFKDRCQGAVAPSMAEDARSTLSFSIMNIDESIKGLSGIRSQTSLVNVEYLSTALSSIRRDIVRIQCDPLTDPHKLEEVLHRLNRLNTLTSAVLSTVQTENELKAEAVL